jgi:hypothetical protein
MEHDELLERVRALRVQRYTPAEVARALGLRKAEAARLVRAVACERDGGVTADPARATNGRAAASHARCWVSPGWCNGLRIEAHPEWPEGAGAPTEASDSGVANVLAAVPDGRDRLSVCGYLVDTWCLGVKNAFGPVRMRIHEFASFRRKYFGPWESEGIAVSLELVQHLVLGAAEYARRLGFEPHRDLRRARRLLGSWEGPSAIMFGRDGKPYYLNGPYEDPPRVIATLERTVGRGGFDYTVSLDDQDGLDHDGYQYTISSVGSDGLDDAA